MNKDFQNTHPIDASSEIDMISNKLIRRFADDIEYKEISEECYNNRLNSFELILKLT